MDKDRQRSGVRFVLRFAVMLSIVAVGRALAQTNGAVSPNTPGRPQFLPIVPPTNAPTHANLAWEASPDSSVVGYKVYWGPFSGTYTNSVAVGNHTNCTITNLSRSKYYFTSTAYDAGGMESRFSNETSATLPYNPPFTNYVLLDWVERSPTNRLLSRTVLTNTPGDHRLIEALVTQTNDQVRVLKMGRIMSIANTNQ